MLLEKINLLNEMQKKAVLKKDGPLLILAGAGSGKTRVLTHRIAYLIDQGVEPFNILAITFTNKAAKEMKERVEKITEKGQQVWVATFHSTCVRILRREIEKIGFTSQFTIYDSDDCEKLIKDIYKENNINDKILPIKYVINEISIQKDKLIDATTYEKLNHSDFKKQNLILIYKEYEKILKNNNALDFDDLIFKTITLFKQHPEILEKYQNRFKYIMVDEYQDTSTSQYTFVKLLATKYQNICVVGDDDQSIYGWRGADIYNILNFEKDFDNTEVIKLEQNYRSTKNILNVANYVIRNNFNRKNKELWTQNEKGSLIKFKKCQEDKDEVKFVCNEIKKQVQAGKSYSDFAVLYRNNTLSRLIEEQLVYSSIPYKMYGGVNFYSRKEIKDVIAYIKILYNPNDEISIKRIINVPKRGIGDATINKLTEYANLNNISFFDAIKNCSNIEGIGSKLKSISKFYETLLNINNYSQDHLVSETIKYLIEEIGYRQELEKEGSEEALARIDNIQELINKAVELEKIDENLGLESFLEEVALVADIETDGKNEETVTLMTIHSSKGLEFPTVFIIGFEEGVFPSYASIVSQDLDSIEEERRLCYVGITRAKEQLYLTCSKERLQYGKYVSNLISRFYKEIPKEYLEDLTEVINQKNKPINTYRPKVAYKPNNNYVKAISAPKNITLDFVEGDSVRHFKFGIGKVIKISPAGADYEVSVEFENLGLKKLMANLCKLQKV